VFKGLRKFSLYFVLIGYFTLNFIIIYAMAFTQNTISDAYRVSIESTIFELTLAKIDFFIIQLLPFYANLLTPVYLIYILIYKDNLPVADNVEHNVKFMSKIVIIFEIISVICLIELPINFEEAFYILIDLAVLYLVFLITWPFIRLED
jgi:hypothetical protein